MAFRSSQLGRFGDLGASMTGQSDPDHRAAHICASNGTVASRLALIDVLAKKGLLESTDGTWLAWKAAFDNYRNQHTGNGGGSLAAKCPTSWRGVPPGTCLHELTPPLHHGNLRWFAGQVGGQADNVVTKPDTSLAVDPSARPLWNFVVTNDGDIVVAGEDFELIKHTCIAGGLDVWSAGQLGFQNGTIRIVDLQSGHYVKANVNPGTAFPESSTRRATELVNFTQTVFVDYANRFGLTCLHSQFNCIWG